MKPFLAQKWNFFSLLVLLAGAAWIGISQSFHSSARTNLAAPRAGFPAPGFNLVSLDGKPMSLEELRGRPVLLNFWATWCPPCKAEMPAIQAMYEEYSERGFVVVGVNSITQDSPEAVSAFVQEYGLTFPVLLDTDNAAYRSYQVRSLPTSFFIDPDGIIQEVVVGGPMAEALLRVRIEALLR